MPLSLALPGLIPATVNFNTYDVDITTGTWKPWVYGNWPLMKISSISVIRGWRKGSKLVGSTLIGVYNRYVWSSVPPAIWESPSQTQSHRWFLLYCFHEGCTHSESMWEDMTLQVSTTILPIVDRLIPNRSANVQYSILVVNFQTVTATLYSIETSIHNLVTCINNTYTVRCCMNRTIHQKNLFLNEWTKFFTNKKESVFLSFWVFLSINLF